MADERYERWKAIADSYSKGWSGNPILPTDIVEYPMAIMSALSDSQEETARSGYGRANDLINAAKLMLSRMKDAAREAERKAE